MLSISFSVLAANATEGRTTFFFLRLDGDLLKLLLNEAEDLIKQINTGKNMKKFLVLLAVQAVATVSMAQTPQQAVAQAIKRNAEINTLVSAIEDSRGLQKCTLDNEEVVLSNQTKTSANFEAAYSCEILIIKVKGEAEISDKGDVTVTLTNLSL